MGILKNEHGVFYVRRKVPKRLQQATAVVTGASKSRQTWLKQSLKTKDAREARRLAPPVLMKFDRILAEAEASLVEMPLRSGLDDREIERIAAFFYASELAADEEQRQEGDREGVELSQAIARQLDEVGITYEIPYAIGPVPKFGLSDRGMDNIDQSLEVVLPAMREALARGDISRITWEVDELLKVFRINLDRSSASYRKLGIAILKQFIRGLEVIARRQRGEPVDTPQLLDVGHATPSDGGLSAAASTIRRVPAMWSVAAFRREEDFARYGQQAARQHSGPHSMVTKERAHPRRSTLGGPVLEHASGGDPI